MAKMQRRHGEDGSKQKLMLETKSYCVNLPQLSIVHRSTSISQSCVCDSGEVMKQFQITGGEIRGASCAF